MRLIYMVRLVYCIPLFLLSNNLVLITISPRKTLSMIILKGYSSGPSIVPVCYSASRKYRHYYSGNRHYSSHCHSWLISILVCAKRFHRHYSGQTSLLDRHYRGIAITGDHSKQDQMLLVKIDKYIGFSVYCRSYLLWSPVIVGRSRQIVKNGEDLLICDAA